MRKTRTTRSRARTQAVCVRQVQMLSGTCLPLIASTCHRKFLGRGFCPALWILATLGNHKKSKSYRGHWYKTCTISPLYSAKNPSLLPCAPDAIAAWQAWKWPTAAQQRKGRAVSAPSNGIVRGILPKHLTPRMVWAKIAPILGARKRRKSRSH
jgi:hypothetical protein